MPFFEVTYEDVGFTRDDTSGCELSEQYLQGYSETKVAENGFPEHVKAITKAYVTTDDGQEGEEEAKVFLPVTLVVEAESEEAARPLRIPENTLTEIADCAIKEGGDDVEIGLENNWEITDVQKAPDFEPFVKPKNVSRMRM